MPKLVANATTGVRLTVVLLLAAVGLLIASLGPGLAGLAWGSVGLSAVAAALILRRWRRSWLKGQDAPEEEIVLLEDEPITDAEAGEAQRAPASVISVPEESPAQTGGVGSSAALVAEGRPDESQPAEEDTDAADLLVVYELTDEVLVVDENPRYHLARCRVPDHERAERLPVREARELGFTPCGRCRPDTALARKHRASRATAAESS
ncbi:MAG: hypothetical protein QOG46_466 [Pseudonocardiales bacterium]|nr:hypothetical protein [Pseudonocardiales bacterium]